MSTKNVRRKDLPKRDNGNFNSDLNLSCSKGKKKQEAVDGFERAASSVAAFRSRAGLILAVPLLSLYSEGAQVRNEYVSKCRLSRRVRKVGGLRLHVRARARVVTLAERG